MPKRNIGFACLLFAMVSCETVKPYQRAYLNDAEMKQKGRSAAFETYAESIREGAIVPAEGKGSGGCGCN